MQPAIEEISLFKMDSRGIGGSDIETSIWPYRPWLPENHGAYPLGRKVQVIVSHWDGGLRISAPELEIATTGNSFKQAWSRFLGKAKERADFSWLCFDLAASRPAEIDAGLDVLENEFWL